MRRIGSKLQKQGVIMALFTLVLMSTDCDEHIDNPAVNPTDEKMVEVSMAIGFADEADACNLSASTKANTNVKGKGAFDVELVPTAATRADAAKPAKLYKLEIRQYNQDGVCYASSGQTPTDQVIGKRLTVSLTKDTDCQLVFVAWGENNSKSLGTGTLSEAQEISVDAATINAISPTDMSQMPYVLHLKHVNVTSDGKITNSDGVDVRILLKRLATRLKISWDYKVPNYDLKQIILQSIPCNYKVVPAPNEKSMNTYPSVMDQYMDIQLTTEQINAADKSYSCWVPANVRGINTVSNGPQYRIKENAPLGSSYVSFIAANTSDGKKKFNYRIYLGGKDYSDYNLNENTDYSYKISFNHTGLPVDDKRVTIIDPIPASENNENFVPTANCFMVAPGGAFCFNPYKYYINGSISENSILQEWCKTEKIQSVKVLWQTKENGDIGDPVLGTVNSADDHTNIVDFTDGNDFNNARIYCRVAPNTTGGSGVIAAYATADGTGSPLWSWHIWVTDYTPSATEDASVDDPDRRVQKYTCGDRGERYPVMDRNLGAMAGYVDVPKDEIGRSKANGFHYQWGRKDPFPSSYTNKQTSSVTVNSDRPTPMMLNLYKPDGISFFPRSYQESKASRRGASQNPTTFYKKSQTWCSEGTDNNWWGGTGVKTVHDPCPAGWRVVGKNSYLSFFPNQSYTGSSGIYQSESINISNKDNLINDGGALVYFEGSPGENGRRTYIRLNGYQEQTNKFNYIGNMTNLWCREYSGGGCAFDINDGGNRSNISAWEISDAHPIRCQQDRK